LAKTLGQQGLGDLLCALGGFVLRLGRTDISIKHPIFEQTSSTWLNWPRLCFVFKYNPEI
jgi:hypothetical protein